MGRWKNQFKLNGLYQRKVQSSVLILVKVSFRNLKRKGSKQPHVTGLPFKKFGKNVKIQIC